MRSPARSPQMAKAGSPAGAIDMNDVEFTAPAPNLAVGSNSTYKVSVDGRGEATLNVTHSSWQQYRS